MAWPLIIHELQHRPNDMGENELFILRDDLLPSALGGNKVRIADQVFADMAAKNATALIMYGDRNSNFCRVLALICHKIQIPCIMIRASKSDSEESINANIIKRLGVEVIDCGDNVASAVDEAEERLHRRGHIPYYVFGDRTGKGHEGVMASAYASVLQEIVLWEKAHCQHFDMIVAPYGTGVTIGGLVAGCIAAKSDHRILGISISSRPYARALKILETTVVDCLNYRDISQPENISSNLILTTEYNCGGYGVVNRRVLEMSRDVFLQTGVPMDPIYVAKAYLGMLDFIQSRNIADKRILFIHTGGTPLFFDYFDKIL